jgi:hypothetical protein
LKKALSRRTFLDTTVKRAAITAACALTSAQKAGALLSTEAKAAVSKAGNSIVDIHTHFEPQNPGYIDEFLRMSDQLNLTGCMLTPFENRKVVAEAAKQHLTQIIPFGYVDLDAPDVTRQVEEFHDLGYRGLGELEFVKKPYSDPSYFPVYELANRYHWVVLFHTGIVLREKFHEPENVASDRMRAIYLEEIARRFPNITTIGAHAAIRNTNGPRKSHAGTQMSFSISAGSTLKKLSGRLRDLSKYFWWTNTDEGTETPNNDPSAFTKLVFGSDSGPKDVEKVLVQYRAMFESMRRSRVCEETNPRRHVVKDAWAA